MIPLWEGLLGHRSHLRIKFKTVDEVWQPGVILQALLDSKENGECVVALPMFATLDCFVEK